MKERPPSNQSALTRRTFGLWPNKEGGSVFGFVDIPVDVYAAASKLGKKRGIDASEVLSEICSRVGVAAIRENGMALLSAAKRRKGGKGEA
jgi:hypothetical protein